MKKTKTIRIEDESYRILKKWSRKQKRAMIIQLAIILLEYDILCLQGERK